MAPSAHQHGLHVELVDLVGVVLQHRLHLRLGVGRLGRNSHRALHVVGGLDARLHEVHPDVHLRGAKRQRAASRRGRRAAPLHSTFRGALLPPRATHQRERQHEEPADHLDGVLRRVVDLVVDGHHRERKQRLEAQLAASGGLVARHGAAALRPRAARRCSSACVNRSGSGRGSDGAIFSVKPETALNSAPCTRLRVLYVS